MTNEAKLTKTQTTTLAEIKRIEEAGEAAVELGVQRKGIHHNAISGLRKAGLVRYIRVEGVGTMVVSV